MTNVIDGLFSLGVTADRYVLPHPKLGLPVIRLIRRVLLHAFEVLRERGYAFAQGLEKDVTAALHAVIENDLRKSGKVRGFNYKTYEIVIRDGEFVNYDFKKIGKSPDLCFKPRYDDEDSRATLSAHDALFVECKPIDKDHAAGSRYCDDGLCRFVNGDYAWAMQEGLMLGYARDHRTIAKHLLPAMQERLDSLNVEDLPTKLIALTDDAGANAAEALRVSRHRREFDWPDGKGRADPIAVYHTWHNCD